MAMGASISMTAANLTMEATERWALSLFSPAPKVFFCNMDDIFCIIHREAVQSLISHLDSIQAAIHFTMEGEVEGKLPFLDVLTERKGRDKKTTQPTYAWRGESCQPVAIPIPSWKLSNDKWHVPYYPALPLVKRMQEYRPFLP